MTCFLSEQRGLRAKTGEGGTFDATMDCEVLPHADTCGE